MYMCPGKVKPMSEQNHVYFCKKWEKFEKNNKKSPKKLHFLGHYDRFVGQKVKNRRKITQKPKKNQNCMLQST